MGMLKVLGLVGVLAVAGCQGTGARPVADPDARAFTGTIISLRPTTSTMIVSNNAKTLDNFNIVSCKWDAQTQFLLDGNKAALDEIRQYMTVQIIGRMVEGQLVVSEARFSSVLPANVRTATTQR